MKPLKQPQRYQCLITSFAMAMDVEIEMLLALIGHDGSQIVFPSNPFPWNRRGHHVQEILVAGLQLGHVFMPIQMIPVSIDQTGHYVFTNPHINDSVLSWIFQHHTGVLIGNQHAAAWTGREVFDPNGTQYQLETFGEIREFYLHVPVT